MNRELPLARAGPAQILAKTEACGVCHTDLHAAYGDWPMPPALPLIAGHDGIGIVSAIGAGVTAARKGRGGLGDRSRRTPSGWPVLAASLAGDHARGASGWHTPPINVR